MLRIFPAYPVGPIRKKGINFIKMYKWYSSAVHSGCMTDLEFTFYDIVNLLLEDIRL